MCITKKATKNSGELASKNSSGTQKNKKKTPQKNKKKFKIPTFGSLTGKNSTSSDDDNKKVSDDKTKSQIHDGEKPEEPQKSVKEEVKKEEEVGVKVPVKQEDHKDPPKRPMSNRPNHMNLALSGTTRKKTNNKYKYGRIDPEELSINNDKTEFLENAQLTKLMSHADVKALMGGQLAPGENPDDHNCQDTVEEVDSEMHDIAFSPLLAIIPKEDDKGFGSLPHPADQKRGDTNP